MKALKVKDRVKRLILVASVLASAILTVSCVPINELGLGFATENNMEVPSDISQVIDSDPARVDNSRLAITPTDELKITGMQPEIDIEQYRLNIGGLVDKPLSLTYGEILAYPSVTEVVLLICPGFFADNAQWTGVPVTHLLRDADIKSGASAVVFTEVGGKYSKEVPLEEITGNESIFLSHTVNGVALPEKHGFPLRLVAEGRYGYDWVKWVENIQVI